METRSNVKLVIAVVGLLLVGLMLFTYYLSSAAGSFDALYQIRFGKSVSGLRAGSTVTLSGVPVGRVTAIALDHESPGTVLITVALNEKLPIRQGVRADISRSLMDGDAALVLLASSEGPLINPVKRGEMGRISSVANHQNSDPAQEAMQIARKLDGAVDSLDADGQAKIGKTLAETVNHTADWQRRVSGITGAISSRKIKRIAADVTGVGKKAERLRLSIESSPEDIARMRSDIRKFGADADGVADSLADVRLAVQESSRDMRQTRQTVGDLKNKVSHVKESVEKVLPDNR